MTFLRQTWGTVNSRARAVVSQHLKLNPVIVKEMRARMRGPRAFLILTGYLTGLGLLTYGMFRIALADVERRFGPGMPPQSALIGQTLFIGLAALEMIFICFITPALTAGAISGELERRTYDMLLATPLRPARILVGKIFASLTYVYLLILAAIPLSSIIFLFGGVALRDVVQAIGLMIVVALTFGMIGVFFSALIRRTGWATVLSYLVVLAVTVGTLFLWVFLAVISEGRMTSHGLLYLNPLSAMASAIIAPGASMRSGGFLTEIFYALAIGSPRGPGFAFATPGRPIWQYTVAIYLATTVILYAVTTQLVKPVRRRQVGRRRLAGWLIGILLLAIGLGLVFGTDIGSTGWRGSDNPGQVPTPIPEMMVPPVRVEREVVVEAVEPTPPPTPTRTPPPPSPAPPRFDVTTYEVPIETYLAEHIVPGGDIALCEVNALEGNVEDEQHARAFVWAYCRAFNRIDGEAAPGVVVSAPVEIHFFYQPGVGWEINTHIVGNTIGFPPEALEQIRESPPDQDGADARLLERAREILEERNAP